ncbi:MAG: hypothetical protein KAS73_09010 [Candidatus Sabulitectum sp.]|nr:hypothetical protein [Candidatus Sabulitectum sp.]
MKSLIFIFTILCIVSFAGAADSSFPEDPAGVEIIDRAYHNFSQETVIYIRLFNHGEQGTVELLKGNFSSGEAEWALLYSWQPTLYNGSPQTFESVTLLNVQLWSDCLLITWIDGLNFEYHEGLASLYLKFDPNSGEVGEVILD